MTTRSFLTCIFLCAASTIKAQVADPLPYADSLFQHRAWYEASIAYERALFLNTGEASKRYAVDRKIQCLKQLHEWAQAITFIKANLNETLPDSVSFRLYYEEILCAYLGGNYENALSVIEQVKFSYAQYQADKRLMLFRILSLNELERWSEAASVYKQLMLQQNMDTAASPYLALPHLKSKDRAQWLSTFIPGGGQFYAGKPLEAIVSIVAQGAGIYFGVISFQQHYYVAAWLVGAGLFGSFHMGGVRRSEVLVDQYNRKKIAAFNLKVKEELLKLMEQ